MIEDKISLTRARVELVERLTAQLSPEERVRIQGELSIVNAKIKALNTTSAAQLKAAADRRKVAGLAEAQANVHTSRARLQGLDTESEDDDPGQTAAIDGWIDAVLLRHDVLFTRSRTGKLSIDDPKSGPVIEVLLDGLYAAARGQELPELSSLPKVAPKAAKPKPKKR